MHATFESPRPDGPWNPGLKSQIPRELLPLCTILRPENVFTSVTAAQELRGLTGFGLAELVAFRPERLALHELLIRITADFVVPDGSRIEDLGINFRRMASQLLTAHIAPRLADIEETFMQARRRTVSCTEAALAAAVPALASPAATVRNGRRPLWRALKERTVAPRPGGDWGPAEIAACSRAATRCSEPLERLVYQTLARVLAALFAAHGHAWGTRDLVVALVRDLVSNDFASMAIGAAIEPVLAHAARREGYGLLPPQERPVVINTKGPSASGKSTLRPLQKQLADQVGVAWRDFALISPDIWRKQLLDYSSLGAAYKYAGSFTADELQIVDQKLDRYMARKYRGGGMTHLLIDRFRFDSFAPDSEEAGSNFLTRFGETAFLFFVITPPEQLIERAWKRGLEVGRYKAVDDTLAHAVEAYSGIPNVFFTWIRRGDKRIRFEFLDNTVPLGASPRTVAFGDNDEINVLDAGRMLDIERYARISVAATSPEELYPDASLLAPERNTGFLERCVRGFRCARFAEQRSGEVYLELVKGSQARLNRVALERVLHDAEARATHAPDGRAALAAVAPGVLAAAVDAPTQPFLERGAGRWITLGDWGEGR
jgi:hypothetical protein